ncbi:PP2C family protein-serine/threonine phosphatase [Algisphaera agarilytica]|uniref:Sigma-B regulation protein RsbU (Phosphoserine phosphatase) n=1 Tax=Algisphaera agarilytica TaxID=1385975 RepID=A0A7X0LMW5_9BACT|nr:PP2C family protein-serine/threonine phosphatase [Algisphaera agarilytica]MBB6431448.1 sigma-B regulation protein RsbU (phosphoserine phosphatase) [Algisphaera agarilytica]
MLGSTLLVVADTEDGGVRGLAAAQALIEALGENERPTLQTVNALAVISGEFELTGRMLAWVWLESADADSHEFALCSEFQEKNIPVLVSRSGMSEPLGTALDNGVVACPMDASTPEVKLVISGLSAQMSTVHALSIESRMLQAQSKGMAGQFDKIDEELRMAVKIQREFLPKQLPDLDGVGFDVMWRPASYVSGDIYDVERLDEHHVGVFIADAVGHGVPAALVSIFIKQSIQTRQITPGIGPGYRILPPGEALSTLNKAMIELDAGSASLGTAAYGVIDTRTQRLTIARAGHPAPLLLRGDGQTQWLEPDGAMLGIFEEEVFEELVIDLEDGDRFLLYSDGFEVAFPGRGEKGRLANEHYTKEFEGLRKGSGQQALDFLQSRLDLQSGSLNQRDDLTVICTSVTANADVVAQRAAMDAVDARSVA